MFDSSLLSGKIYKLCCIFPLNIIRHSTCRISSDSAVFSPEFVEHFKFPATHQALFFYEYQQTFCLAVSQTFQRHHTRFRTRDGHIWCAEFYSDIVFSLTFIEQFNITEFSATSLRWLHSHHLFSNIANLQTPRLFMFIQRYQVG